MHDSISAVEVLPITAADAAYAASIFGPISEARDAEELPFAVEPADPAELERLARHFDEVERYTLPDDLDGLDSEPHYRAEENRADDFMPRKAWVGALERTLLAAGYFGPRLQSVLDHAVIDGTAETIPADLLFFESDRRMIELLIPDAPAADWARHEGDVWQLVETAVGRR